MTLSAAEFCRSRAGRSGKSTVLALAIAGTGSASVTSNAGSSRSYTMVSRLLAPKKQDSKLPRVAAVGRLRRPQSHQAGTRGHGNDRSVRQRVTSIVGFKDEHLKHFSKCSRESE